MNKQGEGSIMNIHEMNNLQLAAYHSRLTLEKQRIEEELREKVGKVLLNKYKKVCVDEENVRSDIYKNSQKGDPHVLYEEGKLARDYRVAKLNVENLRHVLLKNQDLLLKEASYISRLVDDGTLVSSDIDVLRKHYRGEKEGEDPMYLSPYHNYIEVNKLLKEYYRAKDYEKKALKVYEEFTKNVQ